MVEASQERGTAEVLELCDRVLAQRCLILASNRGPVEHQIAPDGRTEARRGSGSVVTAFSALSQSAEFTWVANATGEGDRLVSRGESTSGQPPNQSGTPSRRLNSGEPIWYQDPVRKEYHGELVRAGMARAKREGKRIGRPKVTEVPGFNERFDEMGAVPSDPKESQRSMPAGLQVVQVRAAQRIFSLAPLHGRLASDRRACGISAPAR